jgi:1-acyl-sn-glycerol-3-phosphate acyltransferase
MLRNIIAFLKISLFLISIPCVILSHVVLSFFMRDTYAALIFSKFCCWLFGIKVTALNGRGEKRLLTKEELKPLNNGQAIYLSNHISYMDIIVLGSLLEASFVAKSEVARWPIFGFLAKLQKTVFITRSKAGIKKAFKDISVALSSKQSIIFFPEGTSTNGSSVAPFKSAVLPVFVDYVRQNDDVDLVLVSIVIEKIDGVTPYTGDQSEDNYAWYGDMTLVPHLWNIAQRKKIEINLFFHSGFARVVIDEKCDRKAISSIAHQKISKHVEGNIAG